MERVQNILRQLDAEPSGCTALASAPVSNERSIHGGTVVARALFGAGVRYVFALAGGHICMLLL